MAENQQISTQQTQHMQGGGHHPGSAPGSCAAPATGRHDAPSSWARLSEKGEGLLLRGVGGLNLFLCNVKVLAFSNCVVKKHAIYKQRLMNIIQILNNSV